MLDRSKKIGFFSKMVVFFSLIFQVFQTSTDLSGASLIKLQELKKKVTVINWNPSRQLIRVWASKSSFINYYYVISNSYVSASKVMISLTKNGHEVYTIILVIQV